ncbi:hypothetical protein MASR2M117_12630 [Paludibacter sp.]
MKNDYLEAGIVYHIFNRGNNKENIFIEEKNYIYFLALLKKYVLPIADVYAYCLLKNHFHLIVKIKDIDSLTPKQNENLHQAFSNMFNSYTKSINKMYCRRGSLFQECFHKKRITDEKYLIQLIAYIHLNPVKHSFTSDFKNYRYSSYLAYMSNKPSSVNTEYIMSLFGDTSNFEYWHDLNRLILEDKVVDV